MAVCAVRVVCPDGYRGLFLGCYYRCFVHLFTVLFGKKTKTDTKEKRPPSNVRTFRMARRVRREFCCVLLLLLDPRDLVPIYIHTPAAVPFSPGEPKLNVIIIFTLSRISCLIFSRSSSILRCFSLRRSSASRIASNRSLSASAFFSLSSADSPPSPTAPETKNENRSVFGCAPAWVTRRHGQNTVSFNARNSDGIRILLYTSTA